MIVGGDVGISENKPSVVPPAESQTNGASDARGKTASDARDKAARLVERFKQENQLLAVVVGVFAALLIAFFTIDASTIAAEALKSAQAQAESLAKPLPAGGALQVGPKEAAPREDRPSIKSAQDEVKALKANVPIKVGGFEVPVPTPLAALVWLLISLCAVVYAYKARKAAWDCAAHLVRLPEKYRYKSLGLGNPLMSPTPVSVAGVAGFRLNRLVGRSPDFRLEQLLVLGLLLFWTWLEIRMAYGAWLFGGLELPSDVLFRPPGHSGPELVRDLLNAMPMRAWAGLNIMTFALRALLPSLAVAILVLGLPVKFAWIRSAYRARPKGAELRDRRIVLTTGAAAVLALAGRALSSQPLTRNALLFVSNRFAPRFLSDRQREERASSRLHEIRIGLPDGFYMVPDRHPPPRVAGGSEIISVKVGSGIPFYVSNGTCRLRSPPKSLLNGQGLFVPALPPAEDAALPKKSPWLAVPGWSWEIAALDCVAKRDIDGAIRWLRLGSRIACDFGPRAGAQLNVRLMDLLAGLALRYDRPADLQWVTGKLAAQKGPTFGRVLRWQAKEAAWVARWTANDVSWSHPIATVDAPGKVLADGKLGPMRRHQAKVSLPVLAVG